MEAHAEMEKHLNENCGSLKGITLKLFCDSAKNDNLNENLLDEPQGRFISGAINEEKYLEGNGS